MMLSSVMFARASPEGHLELLTPALLELPAQLQLPLPFPAKAGVLGRLSFPPPDVI
jgi:hypothetical protein